jgi:hypothetical protein
MLLNIFNVNAAHNAVHLLTGVVAILAGMAGVGAAKTPFKIFGVVYGLVAVLGFVGDGLLARLDLQPHGRYLARRGYCPGFAHKRIRAQWEADDNRGPVNKQEAASLKYVPSGLALNAFPPGSWRSRIESLD